MLDPEAVRQEFDDLVRQTVEELRADGFRGEPIVHRSIDMRYSGQNYEQEISLPSGEIDAAVLKAALDEFHRYHQKFYGYSFPDETIELIHFNVTVYRRAARPDLALLRRGGPQGPVARRAVFFKGLGFLETPIYRRAGLGCDTRLEGPAIVEEEDSTVLLHPGQTLTLTEHGLLIISGRPEDYCVNVGVSPAAEVAR